MRTDPVLAERARCLSWAGSSTKTEIYVLDAIAKGTKVASLTKDDMLQHEYDDVLNTAIDLNYAAAMILNGMRSPKYPAGDRRAMARLIYLAYKAALALAKDRGVDLDEEGRD